MPFRHVVWLNLSRHITQMTTKLQKNGKLLISGEYAVLDGALALAMPTQFGQKFHIDHQQNSEVLIWQALDETNQLWFEAHINLASDKILSTNNQELAQALLKVLMAAVRLNPDFSNQTKGACITSHLDFPRSWGLGSSSTLIAAVAQWSQTNPFDLSTMSFGGSGYDVAAADQSGAFTYKIGTTAPQVTPVVIKWPFDHHIYFVHRNKKQNSRESIAHYRKTQLNHGWIQEISAITQAMIHVSSHQEFGVLLKQHEQLIAQGLALTPVQEEFFKDFPGTIKSLGGWGGDFMMVLGPESEGDNNGPYLPGTKANFTANYFKEKGFSAIIPYHNMILGH